jgi:hypothetical protein
MEFAMAATLPVRVHLPPREVPNNGFQTGHPRYGGRQKGTRNKVGGDLREAIVGGIQDVGFAGKDSEGKPIPGEGGCRGFVRWLALYEPKTAAALLARVLPYFAVVAEAPPIASRAEIEAEFNELGLPLGLIDYLQRAPAPLDPGEDPDPYGLHKGTEGRT